MFGEYVIPKELEWVRPLIELCDSNQKLIGIRQPFVYITIRSGLVESVTDDLWHVDGFSQNITHLPEQNYIWSNNYPTEYVTKLFDFPIDFNGLKHNIHLFFQDNIDDKDILLMNKNTIYCLDPYVIHRRSPISNNKNRCFIRLSYTPIEIEDINNTINPLLFTNYKRDGVKDIRNKLSVPIIQYDLEMNFIREWSSMREAANKLGIYESGINSCVNGKQKSSKGFIWKRKQQIILYENI